MKCVIRLPFALVLATTLTLASPALAAAADYVLGPEDELSISVWLHPELEKKVTIAMDGTITYQPLGDVPAAGLTTKQLADKLGDRLSTYLRQTTTVTVSVTKYMSKSIYVWGAVAAPGRYGFQKIPSLLDVLSAAGGAAPGADLTRVQIVRREGAGRRVILADVASVLRDGVGTGLPDLVPGDTVIIPGGVGATVGAPGDAVAVIGEVTRPGLYSAGGGVNVWMLIAQAGGATGRGDLAKVRVVTVSPEGQQLSTLNLRDVLQRGGGVPPVLHSGDVLYVPASGASGIARAWIGVTQVLAVSRDLVNLIVIADYIDRRNKP